mmetsp:Transcript_49032/g.136256  ORF Transcript_49032/g.136256 Transcript_49032/m.136256 type:complete len:307 (-) Transcript_49032:823-1743(-)
MRIFWPPLQNAEHLPHSDHWPKVHGSGSGLPQSVGGASPRPGLHCATSLADSMWQALPFPLAYCTICRWRSATPKHLLEQADQALQSESTQSASCSHAAAASHTSNSSSRPTTGLPQSLGCCVTSRWRDLKPLSQLAEHAPQSSQSPQAPSTQASQLCMAHGATSDFSSGEQSLPPCVGATLIIRSRRIVPPPQVQVQALHCSQSPQAQSVAPHVSSLATQPRVSLRAALQPLPPSLAGATTWRARWTTPTPHLAGHSDHSLQSERPQSLAPGGTQGSAPHGRVSCRPSRTQVPPFCGPASIRRFL